VLMRSRLTDGRCSPRCADDMLENAVSLRSCSHGVRRMSICHAFIGADLLQSHHHIMLDSFTHTWK
jgi:hypothetical protein